jgi:hypothetical protein
VTTDNGEDCKDQGWRKSRVQLNIVPLRYLVDIQVDNQVDIKSGATERDPG